MVSTEAVKELRDKTGVSVMQCKKALEEVNGNMEQALVILRKHAAAAAAKKADRELGAGTVQAYIHSNNEIGTLVELSCETDFVSKNEAFVALAREIAMHSTATNPQAIKREDIAEESLKAARSVFEKEAADKPKEIREKIVSGKIDSYLKDIVLLEQAFIKDPDKSIKDLIEEATQKFGEKVEITRFARFSVRG